MTARLKAAGVTRVRRPTSMIRRVFHVASGSLKTKDVVIKLIGRGRILVVQNPDDDGLLSPSHTRVVQPDCDKKVPNRG